MPDILASSFTKSGEVRARNRLHCRCNVVTIKCMFAVATLHVDRLSNHVDRLSNHVDRLSNHVNR